MTTTDNAARTSAYRITFIVSFSAQVERSARGGECLAHALGRGAAGLRLRRQRPFERERLVHVSRDERRELLQLLQLKLVQLKPLRERVQNHAAGRLVRLAEGLA